LPAPLTSADAGTHRTRRLVPVLGLCLLVGTAAYLMVFTMLGQIASSLKASGTSEGWIVIATIITATVTAALFPALGSVIGQRRLMVATMACLAAGSVVSATATDTVTLLIGRIIAAPGFSGSALSIAIVREHVPQARLSRSFGILATFEGAAAGVGFTLGGAIEQVARNDWRLVFLAIAVAAAATGALAAFNIAGGATGSRRADVPGALLLAGGLVAALLPITEGTMWGWTSWRVAALLAGALALLAAWLATELRRADPLVRLSAIALPGVAGGTLLFLVTGATVAVINLTVPALLEAPAAAGYGAGASVLTAGLDLLPFALAIMAAGFLAGRLARHVHPREIAVATLGCEALALVLLTAFHRQGDQVALLVAIFGIGHGGSLAVEYVQLTWAVPTDAAGGVTGVATAISGVSGAVASAVTTALLASRLARAGATALPAAAGYDHAWLFAAAVAAAGAAAATASAFADRHRARRTITFRGG
jgi:predicted MFS family arabinose efflux permease